MSRPGFLSAEAAPHLGLTGDGKKLTSKLRVLFGLRDCQGLLRRALECVGHCSIPKAAAACRTSLSCPAIDDGVTTRMMPRR